MATEIQVDTYVLQNDIAFWNLQQLQEMQNVHA